MLSRGIMKFEVVFPWMWFLFILLSESEPTCLHSRWGGFRKEKTNCHRFFHTKPLFCLCLCLCFCLTSPLSHAFFIPLTHDTSSWFTNKCKLRQHHLCIAMYASYFIPCHVQSISIDFAVIKNNGCIIFYLFVYCLSCLNINGVCKVFLFFSLHFLLNR